jgi:hypothetical protein
MAEVRIAIYIKNRKKLTLISGNGAPMFIVLVIFAKELFKYFDNFVSFLFNFI